MKSSDVTWVQKSESAWAARDIDGYIVKVALRDGSYVWTIRPPGGGYDLFTGSASSATNAKAAAEARLAALASELLSRSPLARK